MGAVIPPKSSKQPDGVHKSPAVKLHISIKDRKENTPEEHIRKTRKGFEVVEVDGFVFHRKRREDALTTDGVSKKIRIAENATQPQGTEATQQIKGLAESNASAQAQSFLEGDAEQRIAESAVANKEGAGTQQAHLMHSLLGCGDDQITAARLLDRIPPTGSGRQRLLMLLDVLAQEEANALRQSTLPEADLLAEKLCSLLARFTEGVSEALQIGTLLCEESSSADQSQLDVHNDIAARKAAVEGQLRAYEQEESEWLSVLDESVKLAQDMRTLSAEAPTSNTTEAALSTQELQQSELQKIQSDAHRNLTFQVEGLCAMLSSVDELVSRAERQCSIMQAEYHKEKFRTFPHVDSPARLIHEIVKPWRAHFA